MSKQNLFISLFTFFLLFSVSENYSFPGDHNSLTCDKNFAGLTVPTADGNIITLADDTFDANGKKTSDGTLTVYYRIRHDDLTLDANVRKNQENIIAAIKDNLPAIKAKIIANHDISIQITKWGDSLSDFVAFYGVKEPAFFGLSNVGGIYGGLSPILIDSWDDYFTIFANSYDKPFKVQNYGIATYTTTSILSLSNIESVRSGVNWWWDINPVGSHCVKEGKVSEWFIPNVNPPHIQNGKSALRSTLMMGGNDVMYGLGKGTWLPFVSKEIPDYVIENVAFFTDWHIENGKQILLEGTIPVFSGEIEPYDSLIVNRDSVCNPLRDSLIEFEEFPWWVCALNPDMCTDVAEKAMKQNKKVWDAFADFQKKIFRNKNHINNTFLDQLSEVATETTNPLPFIMEEVHPTGEGEDEYKHFWPARLGSINQACINDRIKRDIGPAYRAAYPDYVQVETLYDHFNKTGDNIFGQSFWVPQFDTYRKYLYNNNNGQSDLGIKGLFQDLIHIGPKGYEIWGRVIGTKLKQLGWNKFPTASDFPDPVIEVDNDGPGKRINLRARAAGIFGQESSQTLRIPGLTQDKAAGVGSYGGYYRKYKDGTYIYMKQVRDFTSADQSSKFDPPKRIDLSYPLGPGNNFLAKYLELNGPAGKLGFPTNEHWVEYYGTIDKIKFEYGEMHHNRLNLLNRSNVDVYFNDSNDKSPPFLESTAANPSVAKASDTTRITLRIKASDDIGISVANATLYSPTVISSNGLSGVKKDTNLTYNSVTNYFEGSVDLISSDENGLWYVGNVLLTDKSGKTNSYYYKTATSSTNYVFESSALTNIPIGGKVEKK